MPIILEGTGAAAATQDYVGVIRRNWITLQTRSLLEEGAEPVPCEIVRDLLRYAWVAVNRLPAPEIHIMNDITMEGEQMHLDRADYVIIGETSIDENQHGHTYEFKDFSVAVPIEIHTRRSRQRLYDLMAEVRRIVYTFQRSIRPYQQMYYDRFQETSEGQHNYWKGVCSIRLTSRLVPIVSGIVGGFETPSRPNATSPVPQRHPKVTAGDIEDVEEPVPPDKAGRADLF